MSVSALADAIGLSVSATGERLRRLTSSGAIGGFTITAEPAMVGRPIEALVDVRLSPGMRQDAIDDVVRNQPCVIDAVHLTGRFDVQLRVTAVDVGELDQLLITLKEVHGAEETNTRLVLRTLSGFPRSPLPV